MSDIFTIGVRGLLAFQAAIAVTGQNIANVKTPYYSRREITLAEDLFNGGVNIADVRRVYDETASKFLQQSNNLVEMSGVYFQQIAELESLLGNDISDENKNTIATYLNDALKALRELNGDTSSLQSRTAYLNKLSALANRINDIGGQISQRQANINQSLNATVGTVNQITRQIADLNKQIANANGQDVSALLDLREAQVQELSKYLDFNTQVDESGQLNILINNGTPIVFGGDAAALSAESNPANPDNLILKMTMGTSSIDVTNLVHGGQIAGLYQAQSVLQQAQSALGRLSLGIMGTINAQNKLGIDYNGSLGGNIFNDINSAGAVNGRVLTNSNNAGNAAMTVNITDVRQLKTSDYKLVFDTPTHYTLTRISDNNVMGSGTISSLPQQISADGFTININSGSISAGDQFTISPNRGAANEMKMAVTDPKLLALGWPVKGEADIANKGTGAVKVESIIDTGNSAFSLPQQLNPPIMIQFLTATSYQLVDANTSSVIEGPITYNPSTGADIFPTPGSYDPGYRVSISGIVQPGDLFHLDYNSNAIGDNRNGLVMEEAYQKGILEGGSLSFTQGYNLMSGDIAIQVNSAKINLKSYGAVRERAFMQFSQVSGVSIQEETTNLAMYQECYQASAQILQAAKTVFDTIISIGRS
ncbi:Flagellar hook-associated protein 1 [Aquicella siphonis]|uniref:Flagellar hook-associated protein 1 n=1 Tax=Aquicella siphonis TaxID=254247 RepID=A0A5E4PLG3_9COXI|nr:flagellar hook-associated protein FlgK [Aquicella siphonis]VVC77102.1 Flagellar hook-associated protein 1 [Aquicella siphonis]